MCIRKIVRPWTETRGSLVFIGHWGLKAWQEITWELRSSGGPSCQSDTAWVALEMSKPILTVSAIIIKKSNVVEHDQLKAYWKSEEKSTIFELINNLIIYKLVKDSTNYINNSYLTVVFSHKLFLTFINSAATDESPKNSGK